MIALAEQMRTDCAALLASLERFRALPDDDLDEAWPQSAGTLRALRAGIASAASRLRGGVESLTGVERAEVDAHMRESAYLLARAAMAYDALSQRARALMEEVQHNLHQVRQGGRALRGYASAGMR